MSYKNQNFAPKKRLKSVPGAENSLDFFLDADFFNLDSTWDDMSISGFFFPFFEFFTFLEEAAT